MQGFTGSLAHFEVSGVGIIVGEAEQRDEGQDEGGEVLGDIFDAQLITAVPHAQQGCRFHGED